MDVPLAGRTAVVTGAAHGIGRASAHLLAEQGATVVLADLDGDALAEAADEIEAGGGAPTVRHAADLTRPETPAELMDAAWDATGGLDIVVNVAGYNLNARAAEMDDDTWSRMLDIHATVPFRVLRAAYPYLQRAGADDQRFRKIVNVASIAVMGSAFQANYAAAKSAVVGLTKSLAKEWAGARINVNAVAFGSIDTRLTQPRTEFNVAEFGGVRHQLGSSSRATERAVQDIPFGRIGTAREAAGGIFLLCSPWSDWITGQLLMVSGGQVFGMSA